MRPRPEGPGALARWSAAGRGSLWFGGGRDLAHDCVTSRPLEAPDPAPNGVARAIQFDRGRCHVVDEEVVGRCCVVWRQQLVGEIPPDSQEPASGYQDRGYQRPRRGPKPTFPSHLSVQGKTWQPRVRDSGNGP